MIKSKITKGRTSVKASSTPKVIKKITQFRPMIRSRHGSHDALRTALPLMPFRSVIRFGSTTPNDAPVQINLPEAIMNSSDKLRMKQCFDKEGAKTAKWIRATLTETQIDVFCNENGYPVVLKSRFGSRGRGNTLCKSRVELTNALQGRDRSDYIIEKFYNYNREYRLHVTEDGCFYTCRKMLKQDTPEKDRWFRNDSNSVWVMDTNPSFDRPVNWDKIVTECVKALKGCGLDFGACDVRVQSAKEENKVRKNVDFIIVEINSAPSFGDVTLQKYVEMLPTLLKKKYSKK